MRKFRDQPVPPRPDPDDELIRSPGRGPDAIDRLVDRFGPDAVCATLAPLLTDDRVARIDRVLDARLASLITVVEDVYEPHNGAAVIRSTEALGLQELHVIEPGVRFQAARGITRGCHRWIDLHRWPAAAPCLDALRARGFRLVATTPEAAVPIDEIDVTGPVAVVLGNERAGLPAATIAACDAAVALPMHGFTRSFNLSVSAALVTHQLAARRRAHLGRDGDLDPERRLRLRARWFALKIRGAVGIVERSLADRASVAPGTRSDVAPGPQPGDNPGGTAPHR